MRCDLNTPSTCPVRTITKLDSNTYCDLFVFTPKNFHFSFMSFIFFPVVAFSPLLQSRRQAQRVRDAAWDLQLLKLSTLAEEEERRRASLVRKKRLEVDRCNRQLAREQQAA